METKVWQDGELRYIANGASITVENDGLTLGKIYPEDKAEYDKYVRELDAGKFFVIDGMSDGIGNEIDTTNGWGDYKRNPYTMYLTDDGHIIVSDDVDYMLLTNKKQYIKSGKYNFDPIFELEDEGIYDIEYLKEEYSGRFYKETEVPKEAKNIGCLECVDGHKVYKG